MSETPHEKPEDDDSDKHPLTQVNDPFADDDDKTKDGDDEVWIPPVP